MSVLLALLLAKLAELRTIGRGARLAREHRPGPTGLDA